MERIQTRGDCFFHNDVGERFEYQRHPADWAEVNANLAEFKTRAPASVDFQICSTINIFNIFSLAELAEWVKEFNPKFFYVNTCFDPECFNIQTLPQNIKRIATDRYHKIEDFSGIIDYMNAADRYSPEIQAQRIKRIHQTDLYRKENFADSFTALNNLLKIYD